MLINLPNYNQLRHYYIVMQDGNPLPVSMFLLETDANDWVSNQESKELYTVGRIDN